MTWRRIGLIKAQNQTSKIQLLSVKPLALLAAVVGIFVLVPTGNSDDACRYIKSRNNLSGYESGGPFTLDHFRLTKGRTNLREFLWNHWHEHKRGIAESKAGTVDRGIVTALYIVQPDAEGVWGIDLEIDRPMDPPCATFHADSVVRVTIAKPKKDYPFQTLGFWPPDEIPSNRLADSEVVDSKLYRVVLVKNKKPIGDTI
jgi:hypothetical protein